MKIPWDNVIPKLAIRANLVTRDYERIEDRGEKLVHFSFNSLVTKSTIVQLFSIHIDWRELIWIGRYFDLLEIETPSIHID
jgi:hypothetical protein